MSQGGPADAHLVLGGGGFLGRHLAARLAARGLQVLAVGRGPSPSSSGSAPVAFRPVELASVDWDALIAGYNVIHHYAWTSIPESADADPVGDLELNVVPTLRLLEAARRAGGKRIVFPSSGGTVYGRPTRTPTGEDDPLRPATAYAAAKLSVESYLAAYRRAGWVDARVARLANPYGVGQDPARRQGAVSTFVLRALAGEPITIWGDGSVVRDFLYVDDAVEALTALALHGFDGEDMPVINIGSGAGRSLNQLVATLETALGRPLDVRRTAPRAFDVPVSVLDIARAGSVLGWTPRVSLEEGVDRMIGELREPPQNL